MKIHAVSVSTNIGSVVMAMTEDELWEPDLLPSGFDSVVSDLLDDNNACEAFGLPSRYGDFYAMEAKIGCSPLFRHLVELSRDGMYAKHIEPTENARYHSNDEDVIELVLCEKEVKFDNISEVVVELPVACPCVVNKDDIRNNASIKYHFQVLVSPHVVELLNDMGRELYVKPVPNDVTHPTLVEHPLWFMNPTEFHVLRHVKTDTQLTCKLKGRPSPVLVDIDGLIITDGMQIPVFLAPTACGYYGEVTASRVDKLNLMSPPNSLLEKCDGNSVSRMLTPSVGELMCMLVDYGKVDLGPDCMVRKMFVRHKHSDSLAKHLGAVSSYHSWMWQCHLFTRNKFSFVPHAVNMIVQTTDPVLLAFDLSTLRTAFPTCHRRSVTARTSMSDTAYCVGTIKSDNIFVHSENIEHDFRNPFHNGKRGSSVSVTDRMVHTELLPWYLSFKEHAPSGNSIEAVSIDTKNANFVYSLDEDICTYRKLWLNLASMCQYGELTLIYGLSMMRKNDMQSEWWNAHLMGVRSGDHSVMLEPAHIVESFISYKMSIVSLDREIEAMFREIENPPF